MLAISLNPIDWVTDAAGAIIGGAAETVLDAIVKWLEDGVTYVATAVANELTGLSSLDLGSQTAQQMGGVMKWVALAVAVGSIMVSAVMAAFSGDGSLHDTIREIPVTMVLMAGWFGLMTVWTEAITALMSVWTTDSLVEGLRAGISLDVGIASFVRAFVALLLIIFLIVFFVELLVLNHMLLFGVLIGQVAIALRPVRPLRGVSGQMIRNMVTLSVVPALGVASLALSLGRFNEAGALSFGQAMSAVAGIAVSVLMPMVIAKFLPLGGQTSSTGRSLIGAGAQIAGTAALAATGVGAVAAAGAGGGLSTFVSSGASGGGGGAAAALGAGSGGGPAGGGGAGGACGAVGGAGASGGGGGSSPPGSAGAAATAGPAPSSTSAAFNGPGGGSSSGPRALSAVSAQPEGQPPPVSSSSSGGPSTSSSAAVASAVSSLMDRGDRE